jgi:hypothetical protein
MLRSRSPFLFGSAILGMTLLAVPPAKAEFPAKAESNYSVSPEPMAQVTSVSQLSDVRPTDWAFQALQSLVERYGCIAGYPDKTYRGNQALTRYEFAAGLNACLDRVNELLASATANLVKKEDLAALQKLQTEFAAELATLRGRVDTLEARTATLEKQQFSTTTKLTGEVVFLATSAFQGSTNGSVPVFQDRVRLFLNSSFTGKDSLDVRLATGNGRRLPLPGFPNNAEGSQIINLPAGADNQLFVDWVAYSFPLGDKLDVYVPAYGGRWWDFAPVLNPVLGGGTSGKKALGLFGLFSPIYAIGGGSGLGLNYRLGKSFDLSAGYLAGDDTASIPSAKNGLFNGQYSALAQLAFTPTANLGVAFTYVNAYQTGGPIFDYGTTGAKVGTSPANRPFNGTNITNSYGVEGYYRFSPQFTLNGFLGYTNAKNPGRTGDADIWYYGVGLGFPDLGKKGNLGGIVVGAEPYRGDTHPNDLSLHIEGFYKFQLTDNISITPGAIWITSPNQNSVNQDAVIGTIRTTFAF